MDGLLSCESCRHGAALHTGAGCEVLRCGCERTRERIVEEAVNEAVDTYRRQWRTDFA